MVFGSLLSKHCKHAANHRHQGNQNMDNNDGKK